MRFIYVVDPMCAWCYGFAPELAAFLKQHPEIKVDWIMGGLAPDNDQPMDESLRTAIASYWQQIEQRTQVSFNHDYWQLNTPYRSTYPACRAVIAAETLSPNSAEQMVKAIQSAYYQKAQNPSLQQTLVECAVDIGLDAAEFEKVLLSAETESQLQQHLGLVQQLRVSGFPALFYVNDNNEAFALALGFCELGDLEERFDKCKNNTA